MSDVLPLENGLTPKQQKFTNIVLKQIKETGETNLTKAALQSYDTTDYGTARMIGSENLTKPTIKQTIQEALESVGLTSHAIADNLKHFANARPEKISADVALKGNIELLKLIGAYPSQKHTNVSLSVKANLNDMKYKDVEGELQTIDDELKSLLAST